MFVDVAGVTDPGRVRKHNTDQFLIAELDKSVVIRRSSLPLVHLDRLAATTAGQLMLVTDGSGDGIAAQQAADRATVTAAEYVIALLPWFFDAVRGGGDASERLTHLVHSATTSIRPPPSSGFVPLGCEITITLAFLIWPALYAVHCGSSGLYLLRGGALHNLTADSRAGAAHDLTADAPYGARNRGSAVRAWESVGGTPRTAHSRSAVIPLSAGMQVYQTTVAIGDTILLCTDGLTAALDDDEVSLILSERRPADSTCVRLIEATNDAGGCDNISVVVARALEQEPV